MTCRFLGETTTPKKDGSGFFHYYDNKTYKAKYTTFTVLGYLRPGEVRECSGCTNIAKLFIAMSARGTRWARKIQFIQKKDQIIPIWI